MKKNWYVIYSKPQFEKKIVNVCNRKNIENYFPLKRVNTQQGKRTKETHEPLFISLVFVKTTEYAITELLKIEGAISVLYWQNKPAIIKDAEIEAIKEFTGLYDNITVEESVVNQNQEVTNRSVPVKSSDGKIYSLNCKTIEIHLPSLGFNLVAQIDAMPLFGNAGFNLQSNLSSSR